MKSKIIILISVISCAVACHPSGSSQSSEIAERLSQVKISDPAGVRASIPISDGMTVVNLFDEFSIGCPTGNRFETMERLNSLRPAGTTILAIFSDRHFSTQDVENLQAILSVPDLLVQGDIAAIGPYLISGKLLIVLDSNGRLIWQEKADMSEQQVFSEISKLIQSASK